MKIPKKDPVVLKEGKYSIDVFNKDPIFKVNVKDTSYFVRDWNEAFYLHDDAKFEDINFQYLAAYISDYCDSNISPYTKISRIPRGHHVEIKDDNYFLLKKEFFKEQKEYSDISFQETLEILRDKIELIIKKELAINGGNVACEHSSGLDSNSILGVIVNNIK